MTVTQITLPLSSQLDALSISTDHSKSEFIGQLLLFLNHKKKEKNFKNAGLPNELLEW